MRWVDLQTSDKIYQCVNQSSFYHLSLCLVCQRIIPLELALNQFYIYAYQMQWLEIYIDLQSFYFHEIIQWLLYILILILLQAMNSYSNVAWTIIISEVMNCSIKINFKKLLKNTLNKVDPTIERCTPDTIFYKLLLSLLIFTPCFLLSKY